MTRQTDHGRTAYPVSPEDIATALAERTTFDTGILAENALCIHDAGAQRTICEYRPPAKTSLWLEGSDDPVRVPLPGLIMIRRTTAGCNPNHQVWAVTERPADYDVPLYHAPLPNVYSRGDVCWGSVTRGRPETVAASTLAEDWAQLLGTPFGNHSVAGKSRKHGNDIRELYLELERRNARVYPKKDLVEARCTLGMALGVTTP